mgnify:CR=1 FL=1
MEVLQKTKIPARGLKFELLADAPQALETFLFKKPKSPRGD